MNVPVSVAVCGSRCGICDHDIEEGDRIGYYEDEWCHVECIEEENPLEPA